MNNSQKVSKPIRRGAFFQRQRLFQGRKSRSLTTKKTNTTKKEWKAAAGKGSKKTETGWEDWQVDREASKLGGEPCTGE